MSKDKNPEILPEYDFSGGVRGKYAERYEEANLVPLAPDVAAVFKDTNQVNEALRSLIALARQATQPSSDQ